LTTFAIDGYQLVEKLVATVALALTLAAPVAAAAFAGFTCHLFLP
jgi:enolase